MRTPIRCTLLELVKVLNEVTDNDQEVVAAAIFLINSGRVQLRGNFAGATIDVSPKAKAFHESSRARQLGDKATLSH
jgi:hypothetical protein